MEGTIDLIPLIGGWGFFINLKSITMRELFTTTERARQLRDKGFAEVCLAYADGDNFHISQKGVSEIGPSGEIPLPLYQQVLAWFRDKHSIDIAVKRQYDGWTYSIQTFHDGNKHVKTSNNEFSDYIKELELGIEKALKLI